MTKANWGWIILAIAGDNPGEMGAALSAVDYITFWLGIRGANPKCAP